MNVGIPAVAIVVAVGVSSAAIKGLYESIEAKPVPDAIVKCLTFTAIVSFEPIDNVLPVFNFNEASPYLFPV